MTHRAPTASLCCMQRGNQPLTQLRFVTARVHFSLWMVTFDDIVKANNPRWWMTRWPRPVLVQFGCLIGSEQYKGWIALVFLDGHRRWITQSEFNGWTKLSTAWSMKHETHWCHILDMTFRVRNSQCSGHNQTARYSAAEGRILENPL